MSLKEIKFEDFQNSGEHRMAFFKDIIAPAFVDDLLKKFEQGELTIPAWQEEYDFDFFTAVQDYLDADNSADRNGERNYLAKMLATSLMVDFIDVDAKLNRGEVEPARVKFDKFISNPVIFCCDSFQCYAKSQRIIIDYKDGAFKFSTMDNDMTKIIDFVPEGEAKPDVYAAKVNFPSGNLIMFDWLKINQFNHAITALTGWPMHNLNTIEGKVDKTVDHLKHGLIHVHVGDTMPNVFNEDGFIVIGQKTFDPDQSDFPEFSIGSITTDLHWASVIDRETALEIIRSYSQDYNESQLDEYIESRNLVTIQVNAGEYNVYFKMDPTEDLSKHSADLKSIHDKQINPSVVLSHHELVFNHKVVKNLDVENQKTLKI